MMNFRYVNQDKIPEKLVCSICLCPAMAPVVHASCNNLFCKKCIDASLGVKPTCPLCRGECGSETLSPNTFISGMLDDLAVFCVNEAFGCKWSGDRGGVEEHVARFCTTVPCAMKGCAHVVPSTAMLGHVKTCDFVVLPCPEKCGKHVQRRQMGAHLEKECEKHKEQIQRSKDQATACDALNPVASDIMTIDCGERTFRVARSVLTKYPESLLGVMFLERARKLNRDADGHVHIVSRPETFEHLITWLQYGRIPCGLNEFELDVLRDEAKSLQLPVLEHALLKVVSTVSDVRGTTSVAPMTQVELVRLLELAQRDRSLFNATIPGMDISGLSFGGSILKGLCFRGCKAILTDFRKCRFEDCDFRDAILDGALFEKAIVDLYVGPLSDIQASMFLDRVNFGRGTGTWSCDCNEHMVLYNGQNMRVGCKRQTEEEIFFGKKFGQRFVRTWK